MLVYSDEIQNPRNISSPFLSQLFPCGNKKSFNRDLYVENEIKANGRHPSVVATTGFYEEFGPLGLGKIGIDTLSVSDSVYFFVHVSVYLFLLFPTHLLPYIPVVSMMMRMGMRMMKQEMRKDERESLGICFFLTKDVDVGMHEETAVFS